jgi:hypothetical protein
MRRSFNSPMARVVSISTVNVSTACSISAKGEMVFYMSRLTSVNVFNLSSSLRTISLYR